jgi:PASTA domain
VTVTGTVELLATPAPGVRLWLDGHRVGSTDDRGQFELTSVRKGTHTLALRMGGTWPRRPYRFSVGKSDKKLAPISLDPLVIPLFAYDEQHAVATPTLQYVLYAWLLGRPKGLAQVKSVVYTTPVWVGKPSALAPRQPPFCYTVSGGADDQYFTQHAYEPLVARVTFHSGDSLKIAAEPNDPRYAAVPRPGNCSGGGAPPTTTPGPTTTAPPPPPPPTTGGPQNRTVPNLIGKSLASAKSALQQTGFAALIEDVESNEPAGNVIAQDPRGGTTAARGSTVTLSVSNGPTVQLVPDVTGKDQSTAQAALQASGFKVAVQYQDTTDPSQDGIVVSQDPIGGTKAQTGSSVTIVVNRLAA